MDTKSQFSLFALHGKASTSEVSKAIICALLVQRGTLAHQVM